MQAVTTDIACSVVCVYVSVWGTIVSCAKTNNPCIRLSNMGATDENDWTITIGVNVGCHYNYCSKFLIVVLVFLIKLPVLTIRV